MRGLRGGAAARGCVLPSTAWPLRLPRLARPCSHAQAPRSAAAPPGYLLSEQAAHLKQDNALVRQQLRAVAAERDSLKEDIAQLRDSKHQSDKGWRAAEARCAELEAELAFFRAANARAITDRCGAAGAVPPAVL